MRPLRKHPSALQIEQHTWKHDHPGIVQFLADKLNVSRTTVSLVLNGKRKSYGGLVEAALVEFGAPGFVGKKEQGKAK